MKWKMMKSKCFPDFHLWFFSLFFAESHLLITVTFTANLKIKCLISESGAQRKALFPQSTGKVDSLSMQCGNICVITGNLSLSACSFASGYKSASCCLCQSKIASWHFISCFTDGRFLAT